MQFNQDFDIFMNDIGVNIEQAGKSPDPPAGPHQDPHDDDYSATPTNSDNNFLDITGTDPNADSRMPNSPRPQSPLESPKLPKKSDKTLPAQPPSIKPKSKPQSNAKDSTSQLSSRMEADLHYRSQATYAREQDQLDQHTETCTFRPQLNDRTREICDAAHYTPIDKGWREAVQQKKIWLEKERKLQALTTKQQEDLAMKRNPPRENWQRSQVYEYNSTKKWYAEKELKISQRRKECVQDDTTQKMNFAPKTNAAYNSKVVSGDFFSRQEKRMDRERAKLTKIRREVENFDFKPRLCATSLRIADNASKRSPQQKTMSSVDGVSLAPYPELAYEDRENSSVWANNMQSSNSK
jgi:hypothetical protein